MQAQIKQHMQAGTASPPRPWFGPTAPRYASVGAAAPGRLSAPTLAATTSAIPPASAAASP